MAQALRVDYVGVVEKPVTLADGTIRVPAFIARTGVQVYTYDDGSVVREYRPPEEVFAEPSLASWAGLALTDGHPEGAVDASNWSALAIGHVGDTIAKDGAFIAAKAIVKDAEAISRVTSGDLVELSCGYYCDSDFTPGVTPEGEAYDAIQRNIVGNHVALLPAGWGRAGPLVKLYADSKGRRIGVGYPDIVKTDANPPTPKTDNAGAPATTPAATVPLADYERVCAERDTAIANASKATETATATAKADRAESVVIRASAIALDPEFRKLALDSSKSDREIMLAAIAKVRPEFKGDGRTDEYVRATFDIVCEGAPAVVADAARTDARTIEAIAGARNAPRSDAETDPVEAAKRKMHARNAALSARKESK